MSGPEIAPIPDDANRAYYGPDGQPQFFQDPAIDRMHGVLLRLAQEAWVLTERLAVIEGALREKGVVTADYIATRETDGASAAAREAALANFIERTLGPLRGR